MSGAPSVSRIMAITGIVTMVVAGIGFIVVTALNAFVLDEFDAYGEVPIPGARQISLPAGEVQISFHTSVTGSPSSGFPLPPLKLSIDPPPGAADPVLTERHGGTTTVDSDTHMRVWTAQVPDAGVYQVRTGGEVGGYINPRLAFGRESDYGYLLWVFAAVFGVGLLDVILAVVLRRARRRPSGVGLQQTPPLLAGPADRYTPTDEAVRLEQLKTITALRDSGALTEQEFEVEKRRILRD